MNKNGITTAYFEVHSLLSLSHDRDETNRIKDIMIVAAINN